MFRALATEHFASDCGSTLSASFVVVFSLVGFWLILLQLRGMMKRLAQRSCFSACFCPFCPVRNRALSLSLPLSHLQPNPCLPYSPVPQRSFHSCRSDRFLSALSRETRRTQLLAPVPTVVEVSFLAGTLTLRRKKTRAGGGGRRSNRVRYGRRCLHATNLPRGDAVVQEGEHNGCEETRPEFRSQPFTSPVHGF